MNIRYLKVLSCVLASTLVLNFAPTKVEAKPVNTGVKELTSGQKALLTCLTVGAVALVPLCGLGIPLLCRTPNPSRGSVSNGRKKLNYTYSELWSISEDEVIDKLRYWLRNINMIENWDAFEAALNIYSMALCRVGYRELINDFKKEHKLKQMKSYAQLYDAAVKICPYSDEEAIEEALKDFLNKKNIDVPPSGKTKNRCTRDICFMLKCREQAHALRVMYYTENVHEIPAFKHIAKVIYDIFQCSVDSLSKDMKIEL